MEKQAKQVSVVLGGGGAKGFVHLGVLRALVDRGYDIVALFGTSIGSIIGALFAYHFKFHHLPNHSRLDAQQNAVASVTKLLVTTNFLNFADISLSPLRRGYVKGEALEEWLTEQLLAPGGTTSIRFSALAPEIDLIITITRADNGDPVVMGPNLNETPDSFVSQAVRASMSIQGIFLEIDIDLNGQKIKAWDGGVTGNCRFDLSCDKYPEILTLASSVTYRGDIQSLPNSACTAFFRPLLVADRSADFWLRQIENLTEGLLPDARKEHLKIVRPDLAGVTTTSFTIPPDKRRTLIENGCLATHRALNEYEGVTDAVVPKCR